jgi:hypothetical protein
MYTFHLAVSVTPTINQPFTILYIYTSISGQKLQLRNLTMIFNGEYIVKYVSDEPGKRYPLVKPNFISKTTFFYEVDGDPHTLFALLKPARRL